MPFRLLLVSVLGSSMLGTITGFGLSTVLVPVMLLWYPLPQTLLFVGIIHRFVDVWKIGLFGKQLHWKSVVFFGITGIVFSYVGASLVVSLSEDVLLRILGGVLVVYAGYLLRNPTFALPATRSTMLVGGALSGGMAGLFGVGGAIRSAFLQAFSLSPAAYIATSGAIALIIDTIRVGTYRTQGVTFTEFSWIELSALIVISFVGSRCAKKLLRHVSPLMFRRVVCIALIVLGVWYLVQ